ncbi:MAG: DUF1349 domain-containing protein, partial [Bacteroidales bacterium]|nr:DUF1349 domain-containing protein [Bacteroidales bacterium]
MLQPLKGKTEIKENLVFYKAERGFVGIDSFMYVVSDGKKKSKPGYIRVEVKENLEPLINNDDVQFYAGNDCPLFILGNDADREGDSIFIQSFTNPLFGTLKQLGDKLIYSPNKKTALTDSFRYIISDGFRQTKEASVHIVLKDKNDPCYPWLSGDVGAPALKGYLSNAGSSFVIKASGDDIWNNSDNFHFAYQQVSGDMEIVSRVESIDNTDPWAKAGVMIRETLTGESRNVFMCISSQNGVSFQQRTNPGNGSGSSSTGEPVSVPYWMKITRKGNVFTGSVSPDGKNWTEAGVFEFKMAKDCYAGIAATSHNNSVVCAARFNNNQRKF